MPNTLAHIGINGILTKSIIQKSDLFWIYLGCIIPDIPWIIRKAIFTLYPSINGYDLQLFVIIQASLFFCILLSLALSSLSNEFWKTLTILIIGSLLHLILDPIQIKWANGVHFFAPFSWKLINYGFFWPESWATYLLTLFGILFFFINIKELKTCKPKFNLSISRIFFSAVILAFYFLAPLNFMNDLEKSNSHFVSTFKDYENRIGKYVETDRKKVILNDETNSYWIESFDGSFTELTGIENIESSKVSIQGRFVTKDLIMVSNYKENWVIFRDGASYTGLLLIFFSWIIMLKNRAIK